MHDLCCKVNWVAAICEQTIMTDATIFTTVNGHTTSLTTAQELFTLTASFLIYKFIFSTEGEVGNKLLLSYSSPD